MVPELHIDRIQSGRYRLNLAKSGVRLCDEEVVHSVTEGIRLGGEMVPGEFASFLLVWYADLCIGMRPLQELAQQSEKIAELMALAHAVWNAEEALQAP